MKKFSFETVRQAEKIASKKIRTKTFQWLQAAAEDGYTNYKNNEDLKKIKIIPKQLSLNGEPILKTKFFGKQIPSPLILSPMGHQTQFSKNGEIDMAKGINISKTIAFFGTQSRISLDQIREKNKKAHLAWTIFPFGNLDWIKSQILSAEKNNCIAIAVCIDANIRSHRYLDREINYDARNFGKRSNPISPNPKKALNYNWNLIKFIKKNTKLPLIIKGTLSVGDAKKSIQLGANAIWISNHGGRMLNSGISGVDAILNISKKLQNKKTKIIVDGGVQKGSDIIKYLSLGADFVGIGRPAMYGLICDGFKGVNKIFNILNSEINSTMINGGFKDLSSFKKNRLEIYE